MDPTLTVHVAEHSSTLKAHHQRLACGQALTQPEHGPQASALAELGGDPDADTIDTPVDDLDHGRMPDLGSFVDGLDHSFSQIRVLAEGLIEHFERDMFACVEVDGDANLGVRSGSDSPDDSEPVTKDAVDQIGRLQGVHGALSVVANGAPAAAPSHVRGRTLRRVDLPSARTNRLIIIGALAIAAALFGTAIVVYLGNPRTTDLPVAIQEVSPAAQSTVLLQSDVVVDLAAGYTAEIDINGVPIPEDEINEVLALNQLRFSPGAGQTLERLFTEQNCVRVNYWLIVQGPQSVQTYTWCFDAN